MARRDGPAGSRIDPAVPDLRRHEHALRHDAEATFAALTAFNRWLEEEWGFGADGRIFGVPLLSLVDVELAVVELERLLARGARMVHLSVGPVNGRSPGDPCFDPVWARLAEARVPVAFPASESGYNELVSTQWGHLPRPRSHHQSAWQYAFGFIEAPLMHTLGALVFDNLFGRFPDLRVATMECDGSWVPYLLARLDKAQRSCTMHAPWIGGRPKDRASDVFKSHVWVNPYPEEDHAVLLEWLGPERLIFGSDWPRPEGIPEPRAYPEYLPAGTPDGAIRRMMRDNARELLGARVMDRLNHVKIVTPEPEAVDRLLREVLEVPEGWELEGAKPAPDYPPLPAEPVTWASILERRGDDGSGGFITGSTESRQLQILRGPTPRIWSVAIGTRHLERAHQRCRERGIPCSDVELVPWGEKEDVSAFFAEVGGIVFEVMRVEPRQPKP